MSNNEKEQQTTLPIKGERKKKKEKGHLEYNPKETFALSVTWVSVLNTKLFF